MQSATHCAAADPVGSYLRTLGLTPEIAYFGASEFPIGHRVRPAGCELVYRLDGDELIICDFLAAAEDDQAGKAVLAFIRLIHQIERHVREVTAVRGMFMAQLSDPDLSVLRERLARALEGQGAEWREIDGEPWLVYPMRAARRRGVTRLRD
jgi:hypothetical protein